MSPSLAQKALVEAFGTFLLLVSATGVIINGSFDLLGIALAPGIIVAILIIAAGHISGIHLNPAVSFSFLIARKMSAQEFLVYVVSQFIGAAAGSFTLRAIFTEPIAAKVHNGVNSLAPNISYIAGFLIEAGMTLLLVLVIFAVSFDSKNPRTLLAPFAIGLTIAINIAVMGNITGAAFNPVRWFGPAIAGGYWHNASLYLMAPLVGALIAVPLFNYLFSVTLSSGAGRKPE
jgi:MIP family channel proteins